MVLTEYIPLEAPAVIGSALGFLSPINLTVGFAIFYAAVYIIMDQK